MGQVIRRAEIRRRQTRHAKIDLLSKRYAASKTKAQKDAVMAKLSLVSPSMTEEQFLSPMKKA